MKTIGLIGGTSWHSTVEYYRLINKNVHARLGGANSGRIILYSVNFAELQPPEDWNGWIQTADVLSGIGNQLQKAGAECLLLCSNTPHMVAHLVEKNITIPLISIVEETAKAIASKNLRKVALLGTKFTMEQDFFKDKLRQYGIDVLIPGKKERDYIHSSIYNEFDKGIFVEETREKYLDIIGTLRNEGAEAVIFGCTEIPLLVPATKSPLPVFDTLVIHAQAAVDFSLSEHYATV